MSLGSGTKTIQIVSGANNVTFDGVNKFTLQLPQSGLRTPSQETWEVALKSMSVWYSWFNISALKGNNTFSYTWADGTNKVVVVQDGIWSYGEIRSYLKQQMFANGHYLLDSNGRETYYLDLVLNPALYCLSLTCTPLPAALPADWTNPAAVNLVTCAGKAPSLTISSNGFDTFTGFAAGQYPPGGPAAALYQVNSGVPQISSSTSFNILSNVVDPSNSFSLSPSVLASFVLTDGIRPGSLFTREPYALDWVPMGQMQTFNTIEVRLVDQLMRPVKIEDPSSFVLILNLRKRST